MINRGSFAFAAAPGRHYSARAIKVVAATALVIDMLAPLKLDFDPKFFDRPFGPRDIAEFKASGITGFHHSVGIGGPAQDAGARLSSLPIRAGSVARRTMFTLVGTAADLDHAKAERKIGDHHGAAERRPVRDRRRRPAISIASACAARS